MFQPIALIEVTGQGLYTLKAYTELRLQMSTGDFHTHRHSVVFVDPTLEYFDIDQNGEFVIVNEEIVLK